MLIIKLIQNATGFHNPLIKPNIIQSPIVNFLKYFIKPVKNRINNFLKNILSTI